MADTLSSSQISHYAAQLRSELIVLRRYLHQYPELSWEEEHTAQIITEHLEPLGLTLQKDVGGHGLIAQITGRLPGPTIAYRADMDALPIQDVLQTEYRSTALGISHACGHDAHMTIAVGVAKTLAAFRDNLHGTIRFLFQPAEEALDGAHALIACGALDDPTPIAVLALHTFPLPVGSIGITPGACLAGMDEFQVKFYASDAELPDLKDRAISALAEVSNQTPPATSYDFDILIQRMITGDNLKDSIYLSCWQNTGDSGSDAHISGLISMADYTARLDVQRMIKQKLNIVIRGTDARYKVWYSFTNPPVMNDAVLAGKIRPLIEEVVGPDNVVWFNAPYPFAHEDFALYAQCVPGVFLWLGTANRDLGIPSLLHTADYDIDEESLVKGVAVMSYLLLKLSCSLPA